jgi:hypothetical protein
VLCLAILIFTLFLCCFVLDFNCWLQRLPFALLVYHKNQSELNRSIRKIRVSTVWILLVSSFTFAFRLLLAHHSIRLWSCQLGVCGLYGRWLLWVRLTFELFCTGVWSIEREIDATSTIGLLIRFTLVAPSGSDSVHPTEIGLLYQTLYGRIGYGEDLIVEFRKSPLEDFSRHILVDWSVRVMQSKSAIWDFEGGLACHSESFGKPIAKEQQQ